MIDFDDPGPLIEADEEEYRYDRQLEPEQNLLAAIVHRARLDAKGFRLGSDSKSSNNHIQRAARKWFRERERSYIGGWGYILEALDIPKWMERRVIRDAFIDKVK